MALQTIFINSHPIQYYVPLYQYLTKNGMNLDVWYCDDSSVKGKMDEGFGQKVVWDIPLLEGYKNRFFTNQAIKPTPSGGFFNVVNFNLVWQILKTKKAIIVINGWQFSTYVLCAIVSFLKGHQLWMRCEMPWNQELQKIGFKAKLKRGFLKNVYFKFFKKFLYIGTQNKLFYENMGVSEEKLFFTPYVVDNDRFTTEYNNLKDKASQLRNQFNIPNEANVVLYSGKYNAKKRPMDLVKAFHHANVANKFLIFLGDGVLRKDLENYIQLHNLDNVLLTGFVNQSEIAKYYTIADAFVMCSEIGETWGLSVNEAMNFALPIIASDAIGSAYDLIQENENGIVFKTGKIEALQKAIELVLSNKETAKTMGLKSQNRIKNYSFTQVKLGIETALQRS
jgi:glycosyltransferase involved in cell wall biosynthesis